MTVNEREQKCYDGSLRAIQKSGGLRTLRDEEGIRFSAEILDNTIRRRSVIIIRPNSTSLISYSRRKILDCNRFQALSFPVYIRARPYFDNIKHYSCSFTIRAMFEISPRENIQCPRSHSSFAPS